MPIYLLERCLGASKSPTACVLFASFLLDKFQVLWTSIQRCEMTYSMTQ